MQKYALALEGGGAKGAYQIGAYKALQELGIEVEAVAGTSIGAINGAMIVQGDEAIAEEFWSNINNAVLFGIDDNVYKKILSLSAQKKDIGRIFEILQKFIALKGLPLDNIHEIMDQYMNEEKIRNSDMDFGLVTMTVPDMVPYQLFKDDIPDGDLIPYISASANHPTFQREIIHGKTFIDGGLYDNLPINMLIDKGYENIIAIRIGGIGNYQKIKKNGANIIKISPSENLGHTLDFDGEQAKKNMDLGYFDTLRVFNELIGKDYYIRPLGDDFMKMYFKSIDEETVLMLARVFGVRSHLPKERLLFQSVLPKIGSFYGLRSSATYEDIAIAVYEEEAKKTTLKRFHIYDHSDFLQAITETKEINRRRVLSNARQFLSRTTAILTGKKTEVIQSLCFLLFSEHSGFVKK